MRQSWKMEQACAQAWALAGNALSETAVMTEADNCGSWLQAGRHEDGQRPKGAAAPVRR